MGQEWFYTIDDLGRLSCDSDKRESKLLELLRRCLDVIPRWRGCTDWRSEKRTILWVSTMRVYEMKTREYLIKTSGGPVRELLGKVKATSRLEAAFHFLMSRGYSLEEIGLIGEIIEGPITTCRNRLFRSRQITISHPLWSDGMMTKFGDFTVETPPYIWCYGICSAIWKDPQQMDDNRGGSRSRGG